MATETIPSSTTVDDNTQNDDAARTAQQNQDSGNTQTYNQQAGVEHGELTVHVQQISH